MNTQPDKWEERPGITTVEVTQELARMFGLSAEDIRSWAVIMHVHNETEHTARVASSSEDPDVIAYQLMEGLMTL